MTKRFFQSRLTGILLLSILAGCSSTGALWYSAFGPSKIPAKFKLPDRPTLVLVENYRNPALTQAEGDRLARMIGDQLKENDAAKFINLDAVQQVRENDPQGFRQLSIAALGKSVGAKQIVYIDLVMARVDHESAQQMVRSAALARVRVIDAETGQSLWPEDHAQGYEVSSETQLVRDEGGNAQSSHQEMIDQLARSISHLFYDWKPDTEAEGSKG